MIDTEVKEYSGAAMRAAASAACSVPRTSFLALSTSDAKGGGERSLADSDALRVAALLRATGE